MSPRRPADPRVPPGQGATTGWPVLHVGPVPRVDPAAWRLRVHGRVGRPLELGLDELRAWPRRTLRVDFHCVTGWSRLDLEVEGVALADVLARAAPLPGARSVRFADGGRYDTAVPLDLALAADVLLVDRAEGAPLAPEHGGPLRVVVPSRDGWKSCKWLREVELLAEHRLGFWETRGYHDDADPWREHRLV